MTEDGMIMVRCKYFILIDDNGSGQCEGFGDDSECPLGRRFNSCGNQMIGWIDFIILKRYFIEVKNGYL